MSSRFLLGLSVMFAFGASAAVAKDLSEIAKSWQHYLTQCQQLFQDPETYVAQLPDRNPGGDLTRTQSPDGKATTIYLEIENGYVEAFVDTLSDREIRHCAYYSEIASGWDSNAMAAQYVQWLQQNQALEVVGGYAPIYGADHYRHTVLGMWPDYDIPVQTNIHENEFQIISTFVAQ